MTNHDQLHLADVDWAGWRLSDNSFGTEFDEAARRRMIAGSRAVANYLTDWTAGRPVRILEIGPFFNPLCGHVGPNLTSTYVEFWENDRHALRHLKGQTFPFRCLAQRVDLRVIEERPSATTPFDAIVASQVFNYLDYQRLLRVLRSWIADDGALFINNVVDYGLPNFFSDARPVSALQTLRTLVQAGFAIDRSEIIETEAPASQPNPRLIAQASAAIKGVSSS